MSKLLCHDCRFMCGALQQLANSKVTSRFAAQRTCFVDGTPVSKAVYYGLRLTSTAGAPITAGRVVYAGGGSDIQAG